MAVRKIGPTQKRLPKVKNPTKNTKAPNFKTTFPTKSGGVKHVERLTLGDLQYLKKTFPKKSAALMKKR